MVAVADGPSSVATSNYLSFEKNPDARRSPWGCKRIRHDPKKRTRMRRTRRPIKVGSESRGSNLRLTKRETDAAQKHQERLKLRAKMHKKGLTRDRDCHWLAVEEEVLRCRILDKATATFQQRCATAKQEGWWGKSVTS